MKEGVTGMQIFLSIVYFQSCVSFQCTERWFYKYEAPILWSLDAALWKRPWCWERLRAGGEGDDRGWDGWMASSTRWTRVWVDSGTCWWTGRPGEPLFMGHKESDTTEQLNWTEPITSLRACIRLLRDKDQWISLPFQGSSNDMWKQLATVFSGVH